MVWKIAQKLYTNYTPLVSLNKEIFTLSSIQKCWRRSFIRQEKNISSFSVLHSISLSKEKYLCKKSSLFTKGNIPFLKERLWGNICVWSSSDRKKHILALRYFFIEGNPVNSVNSCEHFRNWIPRPHQKYFSTSKTVHTLHYYSLK